MEKRLIVLCAAAVLALPTVSLAAIAAANTVNSAAIIDGEVKTVDIANGAVTDAKILGPISTSKLKVGTAAGTVAAGDHTHDAIYSKKYANVVVVAKSGGNFTNPIDALNSITDASATNTYLLKIMPGTYDIGQTVMYLKAFVDIEGSGENVTKIKGTKTNPDTNGVVTAHPAMGSDNCEVRNLTIESIGNCDFNVAFSNSAKSIKFTHVSVIASGGFRYNHGIYNAIDGSLNLADVTVHANGGTDASCGINTYDLSYAGSLGSVVVNNSAIYSEGASTSVGVCANTGRFEMTNSTVSGAGIGFLSQNNGNYPQSVLVKDSTITGGINADSRTRLVYSELDGTVTGKGIKCLGVYDANLSPVTCPQ